MVMEQDSPLCGCGGHGCLEALAPGTAIARQAREALASGRESTIRSLAGADSITAEVVAGAAKEGDALGVELMLAAGRRLGCGVINLVHVFNPQVVVIGGGVTNAGELLLSPMRETVSAGLMPVFKEDLAIVPPDLGPTPGSTAPSPWRAAGLACYRRSRIQLNFRATGLGRKTMRRAPCKRTR